jgi:hypothetical protein
LSRGDNYPSISTVYQAHCHASDDNITGNDTRQKLSNSTKEAFRLVPLIDFIGELARHNQFARHTTVEGGCLNMLLRIYVVFPTLHTSDPERSLNNSAILTACKSTLDVLSASTLHADIVSNHPVWLRGNQLTNSSPKTPLESLEDRCIAWRSVETILVKGRLMTIWSTSTWSGANEDAGFQACIDIIEFSR